MSLERELLKAIRAKCKECSAGSKEDVLNCPIKNCPLWAYRLDQEQKIQKLSEIKIEGWE